MSSLPLVTIFPISFDSLPRRERVAGRPDVERCTLRWRDLSCSAAAGDRHTFHLPIMMGFVFTR